MSDRNRWSEVNDYIVDHLIGSDPDQTLEANRMAGLPAIDVSAAQGKMLQLLAKGAPERNAFWKSER